LPLVLHIVRRHGLDLFRTKQLLESPNVAHQATANSNLLIIVALRAQSTTPSLDIL
jgi:hypothetical protein